MSERSVIPLESNPAIFTELATRLGLSPVLSFHDVYSLTDPDLLAFLPQPIYAVILLFPLTGGYEEYRKSEDADAHGYDNENDVVWFKQTIRNGCGLYALLHVLGNLPRDFIVSNSSAGHLLNNARGKSVAETAKLVEDLEGRIQLDENYGSKGQTEAPPAEASVELHFITYIKGGDGHLYELDGRRAGPVDLGECTAENNHLISDPKVAEKIQFYMDNTDDGNKNNFAIMAIGPSLD
ncbi:ubiquitin carboxyl-terminal hydrolase Yuh1p [Diutina catenulata]